MSDRLNQPPPDIISTELRQLWTQGHQIETQSDDSLTLAASYALIGSGVGIELYQRCIDDKPTHLGKLLLMAGIYKGARIFHDASKGTLLKNKALSMIDSHQANQ